MNVAQLDSIRIPNIRLVEVRGQSSRAGKTRVFGLLYVEGGMACARSVTAADGSFTLTFTIAGKPKPKCGHGPNGHVCEYGCVHLGGSCQAIPIT